MRSNLWPTAVLTRSLRLGTVQSRQSLYFNNQGTQHVKLRPLSTSSACLNDKQYGTTSDNPLPKREPGDYALRTCLVTGGASGIGYEITKQLTLKGARHITITSRDASKAQKAIDKMKKEIDQPNAPISFIEADFEKLLGSNSSTGNANTDLDNMMTRQPFNTLINCAGISQSSNLLSTSRDTTSLILRTNLEAPIELSRQLLQAYYKQGRRLTSSSSSKPSASDTSNDTPDGTTLPSFVIINISSLLATHPTPGTSIYTASKAGLTAFTRTLTLESQQVRNRFPLLPPFRANVVVPGYIDTPMIGNFSGEYRKGLEGKIPLGRFGTAREVAGVVCFLVENEYACNSVVNLDGGLSAV